MIGMVAVIWPEPLLIGKLSSMPAIKIPTIARVGGKAPAIFEIP